MKAPLERAMMMLQWFVEVHVAEKALGGHKIDEAEIEVAPEKVPSAVLDDRIKMDEIRTYFTIDGWAALTATVSQKRNLSLWVCCACQQKVHDDAIGCDACLEWLHFKCASVTRKPSSKVWFCRNCYA